MKIIENPSPNFSDRNPEAKIEYVILHYTGMKTCEEAIQRMCDESFEVSAHYCIDYYGNIHNLVSEDKKAWHAGVSFWNKIEGLNDCSIGIEICNKGHEWGYEEFNQEQISSLISLLKELTKKYEILPENIIGHSDIAPKRKEDPGEFFPWRMLAINGLSIYHDIDVSLGGYEGYKIFYIGDKSKKIFLAKDRLQKLGYKIQNHNADFDNEFYKVLTAFYRRFYPERIKMQKNSRYPEDIKLDEKAISILNNLCKKYK